MNKTITIVGAGMAGLSAGCYAQMNGYRTTILERHSVPGGLCTAWKRKGYTFDISMHMLTGSCGGPFHQMWKELGVAGRFRFHYHDHTARVEGLRDALLITTDRAKLEAAMLAISPSDEKQIKAFTKLVFGPDMMPAASLKPAPIRGLWDRLRVLPAILPVLPVFARYKNKTLQEFAEGFRHPFLRQAVRFFMDSPGWPMPDFPAVAMAGFMRSGVTEAGVPLGGSQQVAFHLAEYYQRLGGEIRYGKQVDGLLISGDRVGGVRLSDGSELASDEVVWAADGQTLIYRILQERYIDDRIRHMYEHWTPVKPIVHVMLGVNRDLSAEPHSILMELEEPVRVGGRDFPWITLLHHCFDKSMAPQGKSVLEVWFDTEYEYWEELARDQGAYRAEKERILREVLDRLERRWPGISGQVEVADVPTPATYVRYTGNWKGSPDGWYINPANMNQQDPLRHLPGLAGLHMAGQWTAPFTGTVIAALSGRQVIELLCHRDQKAFTARAPGL